METIRDFEDLLILLEKYRVRYLVIGGLAFIYHARPRYTKDMDLWIDPDPENVARANRALAEFGSPTLLDPERPEEILQIGLAPDRIDILLDVGVLDFAAAWPKREVSAYGEAASVNWIDLDSLLAIKESIPTPKHQEDARVLRLVKAMRERGKT